MTRSQGVNKALRPAVKELMPIEISSQVFYDRATQ
jgi:hypothetical protein